MSLLKDINEQIDGQFRQSKSIRDFDDLKINITAKMDIVLATLKIKDPRQLNSALEDLAVVSMSGLYYLQDKYYDKIYNIDTK